MMWAMVVIGAGIASAGAAGLLLPVGHRLSVSLALVLGAGAGIASTFVLLLAGGADDPDSGSLSFLIASVVGLASELTGLAVLFRRARAT